ncbi:MAG: helix-turn-helix domain-containing protein [Cellulomonadaceae bacterium]|nr:helix-turn-helix domain-containing protein [Cellulomonadaceae bacterium]
MAQLAEHFDVDRNTVGRWINGHVTPTSRTLMAFAHATGVDYAWLRGDDETAQAEPERLSVVKVRHQGLEPRTQ